jgi:hypothetical protein
MHVPQVPAQLVLGITTQSTELIPAGRCALNAAKSLALPEGAKILLEPVFVIVLHIPPTVTFIGTPGSILVVSAPKI